MHMLYVLDDDVALRSWERLPYACCEYTTHRIERLSAGEFDLLAHCDGRHEITASPELERFVGRGFVHEAAAGKTWGDWSAPRLFENRFYPKLEVAITGRCNLKCKHCFMASDNGPMLGQFSWEQLVSLLDGCEACGIPSLIITGGEPLLHPDIMRFVRECARRHINIEAINTNGTLLTPDFLDCLYDLGFDTEIKISFDGLGHHDWLRGVPGTEDKALAAIRLAKEKGFRVRVQTNVHRGNIDCLPRTLEFLESMGVDETRVIRTSESPRWLENGCGNTLAITEYYDRMLEIAEGYISHGPRMNLDVWMFFRLDSKSCLYTYRAGTAGCSTYSDDYPACMGAYTKVAVTFDGEVYPCNEMSGEMAKEGIHLGNVCDMPLPELLQRDEYLKYAAMTVAEIRDANPQCADCQYWKLCTGGCRALAIIFTGDYRGADPTKCIFFKGGYMAKVDHIFERAAREWKCTSDCGDLDREGGSFDVSALPAALL